MDIVEACVGTLGSTVKKMLVREGDMNSLYTPGLVHGFKLAFTFQLCSHLHTILLRQLADCPFVAAMHPLKY